MSTLYSRPTRSMSSSKKTSGGKRGGGSSRAGGGDHKAGEVIHVAFGPGGGRIRHADAGALEAPSGNTAAARVLDAKSSEPVTDLFSPREVAKLLGVTPARLRSLDKAQIVSPSATRNGRRAYTFQDLIALRATHDLLARRVRLRDVVLAIGALRRALPRVTRPLQELRIVSDGRKLVVQAEDGVYEPVSGQMVLDFRVEDVRTEVVRMLRPETPGARVRTAYDLYMQASSLDEDPSSFDQAEKLYRRAVELDPNLAIAYTNLGNIRFRRGDEPGAVSLYQRALEVDDRQPEAHYNLGYVMLERGQAVESIPFFEAAIRTDPRFADAHFNLAMAYEAANDKARARVHWKKYLELEPTGTWADIARDHL